MNDIINDYELLEPFHNKDAGFSRWTFAKKCGKEYFLKEFLDPVYPTDDSLSLDLRQQRISDCEKYAARQQSIYEKINHISHGNIVRIHEFFRCDNHYYIATEKVDTDSISIENILSVPFEDRLLICKILAFEISSLHQANIVHSDLKTSNIMIKRTKKGRLIGKIIDLDSSFFEYDPPQYEDELGGDQVYMAPEACQFICGDSVELTCKIDVFALGLLFHEYLTGRLPEFDTNEYDYAFDAVLDDQVLILDKELHPRLKTMISGMLECDPSKRLSMETVYSLLEEMDHSSEEGEEPVNVFKEKEIMSSNNWFYEAGDL